MCMQYANNSDIFISYFIPPRLGYCGLVTYLMESDFEKLLL